MIVNFADLKRGGTSAIEKLNEEASKFKTGGFTKDERFWTPEIDKSGEGGAVFRFLPAPPGEDVPFVRRFSYGFKGPTGKWFIENCPSTIGKPSPVMELNSELWETGLEENKDIARSRKRRLHFISNIYVVRHKARPSDEGKVFLYEYGKKIWDKLNDKMSPDEEDRAPMNPFDLWTGANFRFRRTMVSGFPNYDKSEFDAPGPLSNDDAELEKIWKQCHSLQAEVAPDKFKGYDELKNKLHQVLGMGDAPAPRRERRETMAESRDDDTTPPWDDKPAGGGDSDLAWLRDLANGD